MDVKRHPELPLLTASWRTTSARGFSISTSSGTPLKVVNVLSSPAN
jgi:hypothetical protein